MKPEAFYIEEYNYCDYWKTVEKDGVQVNLPVACAIEEFTMNFDTKKDDLQIRFKIGELLIGTYDLLELVSSVDGFSEVKDFIDWFDSIRKKKKVNKLKGQVIHWTMSTVYDIDNAQILKDK